MKQLWQPSHLVFNRSIHKGRSIPFCVVWMEVYPTAQQFRSGKSRGLTSLWISLFDSTESDPLFLFLERLLGLFSSSPPKKKFEEERKEFRSNLAMWDNIVDPFANSFNQFLAPPTISSSLIRNHLKPGNHPRLALHSSRQAITLAGLQKASDDSWTAHEWLTT